MNKAVETVAKRILDLNKNIDELEKEMELKPHCRSFIRNKIQMAKEVLEFNKSIMTAYLNEQEHSSAH